MSLYDDAYIKIAEDILENGYRNSNRTGTDTLKLPHKIMQFDLEKEFPILTTKKVAFKTAVKEMLWIFRDQSSDVRLLTEQNVHIWDEWTMADGTIGTSYGFVVKEYSQVDKLIHSLKENPQDRRMMINLWQIPFLDSGALYPCCFLTIWDVTDGKLNCMLVQRSGDWGLGIPFNTCQYAVLTHMLAQVTGHRVGLLTHVISNAHIYVNHIDALKAQISRKHEAYPAPKLWLNPNITDFYGFNHSDVKLVDYKYHDKIEMEISV